MASNQTPQCQTTACTAPQYASCDGVVIGTLSVPKRDLMALHSGARNAIPSVTQDASSEVITSRRTGEVIQNIKPESDCCDNIDQNSQLQQREQQQQQRQQQQQHQQQQQQQQHLQQHQQQHQQQQMQAAETDGEAQSILLPYYLSLGEKAHAQISQRTINKFFAGMFGPFPKPVQLLHITKQYFKKYTVNGIKQRWSMLDNQLLVWIGLKMLEERQKIDFAQDKLPEFTQREVIKIAYILELKEECILRQWLTLQKRIVHHTPWTPREDEIIIEMASKEDRPYQIWKCISDEIFKKCNVYRKPPQLCDRWQFHLNPSLNKEKWSLKEDYALLNLVTKYGKQWSLISRKIGTRNLDHVRYRFSSLYNKYFRNVQTANTRNEYTLSASGTTGDAFQKGDLDAYDDQQRDSEDFEFKRNAMRLLELYQREGWTGEDQEYNTPTRYRVYTPKRPRSMRRCGQGTHFAQNSSQHQTVPRKERRAAEFMHYTQDTQTTVIDLTPTMKHLRQQHEKKQPQQSADILKITLEHFSVAPAARKRARDAKRKGNNGQVCVGEECSASHTPNVQGAMPEGNNSSQNKTTEMEEEDM